MKIDDLINHLNLIKSVHGNILIGTADWFGGMVSMSKDDFLVTESKRKAFVDITTPFIGDEPD